MTKLSDTALILLGKAAERDNRFAIVPPKLPAAARKAVANSLKRQGLLEDVRPVPVDHAWGQDEDGANVGLRLTDAGFRGLNLEPPGAGQSADTGAIGAPTLTSGAVVAQDAVTTTTALDAAHSAPVTVPRTTLRDAAAAAAVLAEWDDRDNQQYGLPEAIELLRAILATKPGRASRDPNTPRTPREGTKQQAVLALLRRPEGTNIAQIVAATAWAKHTVRGFLANLKRKGITVEVLERIRQVGAGSTGAKGSYSIYHIADAG